MRNILETIRNRIKAKQDQRRAIAAQRELDQIRARFDAGMKQAKYALDEKSSTAGTYKYTRLIGKSEFVVSCTGSGKECTLKVYENGRCVYTHAMNDVINSQSSAHTIKSWIDMATSMYFVK